MSSSKPIAFLSMDDLVGYVSDDELAYAPLQELGWVVETVSWRDKLVQWEQYAAVIIRTTWDYQKNLPAFLEVLTEIESRTRLANSLAIARWNADKIYLRQLESKGVQIVPTLWGENLRDAVEVGQWFGELGTNEIVVKPTISGGAEYTYRLTPNSPQIEEAVENLASRAYMVQPFLNSIIEEGEYSLFYFNGVYSHTIQKTPAPNDFRVQEEHGGIIEPFSATPELRATAESILSLLEETPLYARVDLVREGSNSFALMELELIEPSLYLRMDADAPSRFAQAIDTFLRG